MSNIPHGRVFLLVSFQRNPHTGTEPTLQDLLKESQTSNTMKRNATSRRALQPPYLDPSEVWWTSCTWDLCQTCCRTFPLPKGPSVSNLGSWETKATVGPWGRGASAQETNHFALPGLSSGQTPREPPGTHAAAPAP